MIAASRPRSAAEVARLLVIDPAQERFHHTEPRELARYLEPRDLVVLNDAATLPASFAVQGRDAELRLIARGKAENEYRAILFGAGDYRTPTELRPEPPVFGAGEILELGSGLRARVILVDVDAPRLIAVRFELTGAPLLRALYAAGRPIQYAYVPAPLALWDVQNRFAARPWAFELPSAGQAFDGELLLALKKRGVGLASLTHAAGISSTGSERLDRRLPVPERFEIPASTADALARTRVRGGRVLAVGTTVVRALEASAGSAGDGEAALVLGPSHRLRAVHGILSGMHELGTSHFSLLEAFAPRSLLEAANAEAREAGYRQHEFGDFCLIWSRALA